MRQTLTPSPVRKIKPIECWFLHGLSVHDFEPEPMPGTGGGELVCTQNASSVTELANFVPSVDKRDWGAVCGLLAILLPLIGSAVLLWVRMREGR